jgi:nitrile hydratase accessory protein
MRIRPCESPLTPSSPISIPPDTRLDPDAARAAARAVPSIPRDDEGPVFREPWEAQAFAMALALHARGLFTWPEWAATLAEEIKRAQAAGDPDTGETYYRHWLATLERLVAEKGVTTCEALARYHDAWDRAADRTPHGQPIELRDEDFVEP